MEQNIVTIPEIGFVVETIASDQDGFITEEIVVSVTEQSDTLENPNLMQNDIDLLPKLDPAIEKMLSNLRYVPYIYIT